MKRIGYYPGCSQLSTARDYNESLHAVLGQLGYEPAEIEGWNCCGASPAHAESEELGLALPYRNLLKAREAGEEKILAPCPACYSRLKFTGKEITEKPRVRGRMEELVPGAPRGPLQVLHLLEFLRDEVGLENLRAAVKKPLAGLRIGGYYGCLLRLPGVEIDDPEQPRLLEDILAALGAEPVPFSHRIECCGAALAIPRTDVVVRLAGQILGSARASGADALAVLCGLCQTNLDSRQSAAEKLTGKTFSLPVFYLTQLIGLAFGLGQNDIHLDRMIVSPYSLFKKWGGSQASP